MAPADNLEASDICGVHLIHLKTVEELSFSAIISMDFSIRKIKSEIMEEYQPSARNTYPGLILHVTKNMKGYSPPSKV